MGVAQNSYATQRIFLDFSQKDLGAGLFEERVLIFGSIEGDIGDNQDIVMKIIGPTKTVRVSLKNSFFNLLWLEGDGEIYGHVPSFLLMAGTRPLDDILGMEQRKKHHLTWESIRFDEPSLPTKEARAYRDALVRGMVMQGVWLESKSTIAVKGHRLFHFNFILPPNAPTGAYRIETLLIEDGVLVSSHEDGFSVRHRGLNAWVNEFSRHHSLLYGVLAALSAFLMGLMAAFVFRKSS